MIIYPHLLLKNDCDQNAICIETGPNSYRCECPSAYRELLPAFPGQLKSEKIFELKI